MSLAEKMGGSNIRCKILRIGKHGRGMYYDEELMTTTMSVQVLVRSQHTHIENDAMIS
jgi:hypothetical protein